MKTEKYFSDKMLLFFTACVLISFLAQIFKIGVIVNALYVVSLLTVLACYFLSGYINVTTAILIVLVGIAALARGLIYEADYFTHILITICIFICIDVSAFVKISVETYKTISNMFLFTALILIVAYYIGPLKNSYFKWSDSICLNFPNPNVAGLWLTCFFVILFFSSFLFRKAKKLLFLVAAVALLPIVVATQSRNSYFACIFLVVCVLITRTFNVKKAPKWLLITLAALPLIVFFIYMFVIVKNMDFWQEFFSLDNINKGIDTREHIWQGVLDNFGDCFLIGNYHKYFDSQQHNSLLTIFCRFGAITTFVLCMLLYRTMKNLQDNSSFFATLSLAAILFTGCFEASVFVGIAGMYLMLLLIPACASAGSDYFAKKSKETK